MAVTKTILLNKNKKGKKKRKEKIKKRKKRERNPTKWKGHYLKMGQRPCSDHWQTYSD